MKHSIDIGINAVVADCTPDGWCGFLRTAGARVAREPPAALPAAIQSGVQAAAPGC